MTHMSALKMIDFASKVRVVQGKETEHFMRIFKGKMVIYQVMYPIHTWQQSHDCCLKS